jgi:GNAT superfamily N-acetyltransferase
MTASMGSGGPAPAGLADEGIVAPAVAVVPAVAVEPRTDTSPAGLLRAIHDDVVRSATRRRTIAGEQVVRTAELTAYRSDIASPDVNVVIETRFGPRDAADRAITETIGFFDGRPFLWWVGDRDTPEDLGERLRSHGLAFLDQIPGMAMDLADLAEPGDAPPPAELEITPVLDVPAMDAFHAVLVQGFPEDFAADGAMAAIAASTTRTGVETDFREPNGLPTRWLGTVDGRPVTTTRLHTAAGVAGIYTVITAASQRRRGYGGAITRHVLHAARDHGFRIATLQASAIGRGVYEQIGFRERCGYRLHEWRPG